MPISEAQKRATAKYHKKAYDRVEFKVKKGLKEKIETAAAGSGLSLSSYIIEAIDKKMMDGGYPSLLEKSEE